MSASEGSVQESIQSLLSSRSSTAQAAPVSAPIESVPTGEPAKVETAKAETAPPAEGVTDKAAPARDETGKFAKAEEPAKAPEVVKDKPRADVAAIIDERRKRQALEQRLKELEAGKPANKPSVFEDEDKAISSRVDEAIRPIREALYKQSLRSAASLHKDDFESAQLAFVEASQQDDRLIAGLRASEDPGEYIYSMGAHIRELADVNGDLGAYKAKITGAMKTDLDARDATIKSMQTEIDALKKAHADLESLPRSLNTRTSGASPKPGDGDAESIKTLTRFGNPQKR